MGQPVFTTKQEAYEHFFHSMKEVDKPMDQTVIVLSKTDRTINIYHTNTEMGLDVHFSAKFSKEFVDGSQVSEDYLREVLENINFSVIDAMP